jgi:hypothetical protein
VSRPVDYSLAVWEDDGGAREGKHAEAREDPRRSTGDAESRQDDAVTPRIEPNEEREPEPEGPS